MQRHGLMKSLEEMQDPPRPIPGLRKTIDTILNVVRQSRGAEGAADTDVADAAELMKMFRDDPEAAPVRDAQRPAPSREENEAAELARIRRALYQA